MAFKRITVRVSPALHRELARAAAKRQISLNRFVAEALEASIRQEESLPERASLRQLSVLLAPAAEGSSLTEDELLKHVREVRRSIWKERYQEATQAAKATGA
jgi:predicted transcriptional regulator